MIQQLANTHKLLIETGTFNGVDGTAIFDQNKTRRYFLEKRWSEGENIFTAVMMNPSNAAHDSSDDTVDQIIEVAKSHHCHALRVVNVSSIIGGTSSKLTAAHFAYESLNWSFVSNAMASGQIVFLGWGMKGQKGLNQQNHISNAFKKVKNKLYSYDVMRSTDRNYANRPIYYVPHPRPQLDKERYLNEPIRKIDDIGFLQLFNE
ncbi:uncharacterized protein DUF1643 [Ureibacillus xyleni]|uniref:Uncharacterized protein DUF1643 n=1 Tax=Ureibacillus xyleni TaxID=614648 RepID=A0A285TN21_9BACL|nr:DUF1643 domain-containing protein [Ureibacillus xyleni]SOC23960.1 uncharacterized protein DUF1643 [Ureibacillus xyleni]